MLKTVFAAASLAVSAGAQTTKMNGWFPCSEVTFADSLPDSSSNTTLPDAECATFKAPLCYDGVCQDAQQQQIDIFVKRVAATSPGKPSIILMQGGPGAGSTAMESGMTGLYSLLNGAVNVYTLDHRGTGRSTKLDCVAAQAETSASPGGTSISSSEVSSCAADLQNKYGQLDMSAFSLTSAASDLNLFITNFLKDTKTFVYGVSYGSSLVERLIHLSPPGVGGYILDGISTTSGAPASQFENFSTWDGDYDEVGRYFTSFCEKNQADCGKYFPNTTLATALQTLTTNLDDTNYKCTPVADALFADLWSYDVNTSSPADSLRSFMGTLLARPFRRPLISVVTYRLTRCSDDDVKVLQHFIKILKGLNAETSEDDQYDSDLVYKTIVYSEFWESPTPSTDEMYARFTNTTISSGSYGEVETYCAFSKEKSKGCKDYLDSEKYKAPALVYKKDKYWNKAAKPPSDVSVLLMSSKMDPQTPHKYAERLFKALNTKNKDLVVFEQATHGTLWSTPLVPDDANSPICGQLIVASYLAKGGDLSKVDKSCIAKVPPVTFQVDATILKEWLNTTSPYDGPFVGRAAALGEQAPVIITVDSGSKSSYKTGFVTFGALFGVAVVAAFAYGARKYRKNKADDERRTVDEILTPKV